MPYVLDALYLLLLTAVSPLLMFRSWNTGKYRDGWGQKFLGRAPRRIGKRPCIWFHAVSVGEVLLLRTVIAELGRRRPGWDVVVSTTSTTGLEMARQNYPDLITFYAPLDFSWAVRRSIARIRPTVLALVELELWPNLIREAGRQGVRVAVINGRLSHRSHRGYRLIKSLLGPTFRRLNVVAAQSRENAERFIDLGVPGSRVHVTGSIKYDNLESDRNNSRTLRLRSELGLKPTDVVFVAGSTMEGEELAAWDAYQAAREAHPGLRMIVVPRHPERFDKVADLLEARGAEVWRRSHNQGSSDQHPRAQSTVILMDTVGDLGATWGLADVGFVGGSLYPGRGGQNMMEPSAYGAAVLFGPHTTNFRDAVEGLLGCGAARRVADADDLKAALCGDLDDPESAHARGITAQNFVLAQLGAGERTLSLLDRLIETPVRPHQAPRTARVA